MNFVNPTKERERWRFSNDGYGDRLTDPNEFFIGQHNMANRNKTIEQYQNVPSVKRPSQSMETAGPAKTAASILNHAMTVRPCESGNQHVRGPCLGGIRVTRSVRPSGNPREI